MASLLISSSQPKLDNFNKHEASFPPPPPSSFDEGLNNTKFLPTTAMEVQEEAPISFESVLFQWKDQEDGALVLQALEYLDVVTLIQKKPVCSHWQQLCTETIDHKCIEKKKFHSNKELKRVVRNYIGPDQNEDDPLGLLVHMPCSPMDAEGIASSYGYPIDKWDVSCVKDLSCIFKFEYQFNESIRSWNVSNATTMKGMFNHAQKFNQDISSWDVSKVSNMTGMFARAMSFNLDISSWDVSAVKYMNFMFYFAKSFNKPIGSWNISNVTTLESMFHSATSYNQDIGSWNLSKVSTISSMFNNAKSFDQDISSWNVARVRKMGKAFYNAELFNQDISRWKVSKANDMFRMFSGAKMFNQDISSWDISSVVLFSGMFFNCTVNAEQLPWFTAEMRWA